jgi:hypothetical protein
LLSATCFTILASSFGVCAWADMPSVMPFQPDIGNPDGSRKWGGRTVAIDVSPANTAVAIAAAESGGLFLTMDSGATWSHIDTLPPFRMSDVKFAPTNPKVIIASAWEDSRTINAGGIWRSSDGGATWEKPATSTPPPGPECRARPSTWGISFPPRIARLGPGQPVDQDVFVGTDCGVAVSHDLGANWTHVTHTTTGVPLPTTWAVVASPGGSLLAPSFGIVDTCSEDGHHRSTDRGASFGEADHIGSDVRCPPVSFYVHAIAVSPIEADVLFATTGFNRLWESDDGGVTWTNLAPPPLRRLELLG